MANLNKVLLMGNLTRDPEVRYTPSGAAVVEFGMAINRKYASKEGEQRDETCFVDVSMWGKRGMVISEYFKKGSPIFIEGRLHYRSWEDSSGKRQSKLSVVAENFEFLSSGRGGGQGASGGSGGGRRSDTYGDAPRRDNGPPSDAGNRSVGPMEPTEERDVGEDEIPF